jgi:hypothetical protein
MAVVGGREVLLVIKILKWVTKIKEESNTYLHRAFK